MSIDYQNTANQLKLFAHPERLRVLDVLRHGAACVCHLEAYLARPQPYVSQQLRFLREAGLITDTRQGNNISYTLAGDAIRDWLDVILGPADQPDPEYVHYLQTIPCECPECEANLQVTFIPNETPKEIEMSKAKVLFLCTGNSARSQMAEAFLRKYAGDRYEVYSAGLEPKGLNPYTLQVMEEAGLDMSAHRSKDVREYMGFVNFGYIFTVCDHAEKNCPTIFLSSGEHHHWGFEDPAAFSGTEEETLAKFREVRDLIEGKIRAWVAN
ncbi:MAG: metalloregulator ArsR/SmtB family transcription factor [Anaerolineales bacterium]|nr:metalloregulator ArsR/SmtB family transcription factor [Anaerolineales bacterium]